VTTARVLLSSLALAASALAQAPPAPATDVSKLDPGLYARINTSVGTITALLFEKEAPNTVRNFIALARGTQPWLDPNTKKVVTRPLYANLIFHRVIPNFMIQTGDPTATGAHNCGYNIPDEIVPKLKFDHFGRLAMANTGTPNSGACQFFITEDPYPAGDGKYTIFGQVVDGQELVAKIAHVIRDDKDKPRVPTKLIDITFVRIVEPAKPAVQPPPQP
jgi:cyclophilin family peptidyl-prolyl cis-trans isomerase